MKARAPAAGKPGGAADVVQEDRCHDHSPDEPGAQVVSSVDHRLVGGALVPLKPHGDEPGIPDRARPLRTQLQAAMRPELSRVQFQRLIANVDLTVAIRRGLH